MAPHVNGLGKFDDKDIKLLKANGYSDEQIRKMDAEALTTAINTVKLKGVNPEELPADRSIEKFKREEQENPGFWQRPFGKAVKTVGAFAGVAALGYVGVKVGGALISAGHGGLVTVGGIAAAGLIAYSCKKQNWGGTLTINNTDNVTNTTNIHNHIELTALLEAIQQLKDKLQEIIDNQETMIGQQAQMQLNQLKIIQLMEKLLENQAANHQGLIDMLGQIYSQLETMDLHQQENTIAVLNALQELKEQNEAQYNMLMAKLDEMNLNIVTGFSNTIAAIIQQGGNISDQINQLIELMGQVQTTLTEVLAAIHDLDANMQAGFEAMLQQFAMNGATLEEILAMLQNIKTLVQQGNAQNQQYFQNIINGISGLNATIQNGVAQILAAISGLGANLQGYFLQLLDAIVTGHGDIQALLNELLSQVTQLNNKMDEVLAAIHDLDANMQAGFTAMMDAVMANGATLEQVLAMLDHIMNMINQVNNNVQNGNGLLQQILGGINNLNATIQTGVAQILAALDGISAALQANVLQILAKLDQMDEHHQSAVLQMLQHMINIENGQDQQNQNLQTIINLIENLDLSGNAVDLTPVINAINNLNNNVTQQSLSLGALVAQVLNKLDSIDDKVGVVKTIAQSTLAVAQHVDGDVHIIIGLLNQIIDNQCDDCCDEILVLLEEILAALYSGSNDEGFHEGDFDDLFSK